MAAAHGPSAPSPDFNIGLGQAESLRRSWNTVMSKSGFSNPVDFLRANPKAAMVMNTIVEFLHENKDVLNNPKLANDPSLKLTMPFEDMMLLHQFTAVASKSQSTVPVNQALSNTIDKSYEEFAKFSPNRPSVPTLQTQQPTPSRPPPVRTQAPPLPKSPPPPYAEVNAPPAYADVAGTPTQRAGGIISPPSIGKKAELVFNGGTQGLAAQESFVSDLKHNLSILGDKLPISKSEVKALVLMAYTGSASAKELLNQLKDRFPHTVEFFKSPMTSLALTPARSQADPTKTQDITEKNRAADLTSKDMEAIILKAEIHYKTIEQTQGVVPSDIQQERLANFNRAKVVNTCQANPDPKISSGNLKDLEGSLQNSSVAMYVFKKGVERGEQSLIEASTNKLATSLRSDIELFRQSQGAIVGPAIRFLPQLQGSLRTTFVQNLFAKINEGYPIGDPLIRGIDGSIPMPRRP